MPQSLLYVHNLNTFRYTNFLKQLFIPFKCLLNRENLIVLAMPYEKSHLWAHAFAFLNSFLFFRHRQLPQRVQRITMEHYYAPKGLVYFHDLDVKREARALRFPPYKNFLRISAILCARRVHSLYSHFAPYAFLKFFGGLRKLFLASGACRWLPLWRPIV